MKIYLDTCSLQRPFDSKTQVRILLESEAVLGILNYVENKNILLINSEVLEFEINRIPSTLRRVNSKNILKNAKYFVKLNKQIIQRARNLYECGIMSIDALHVASAEFAKADVFCTCDDKLISRLKRLECQTKIMNPIELIGEIEK